MFVFSLALPPSFFFFFTPFHFFFFSQPVSANLLIGEGRAEKVKRIKFRRGTNHCTRRTHVWMWTAHARLTQGLHLGRHKVAVGCEYRTRSVCLHQMTDRVRGPLHQSTPALSIRRRSAYSGAKSFPMAAPPNRINAMSNADKLLLNRPAPASKVPTLHRLPQTRIVRLMEVSTGAPEGLLLPNRPPGIQAPSLLNLFSCHPLNRLSVRMLVSTAVPLIRGR